MNDDERSNEVLAELVRLACFTADGAVIDAVGATGAEKTRIALTAALDALERQGYITITPRDKWPAFYGVSS